MIELRTYDLPDSGLLAERENDRAMLTWVPEQPMVIVGSGSDPLAEVNLPEVESRGIPVVKRPTGGCSVLLTPKMLVVAFALYEEDQTKSSFYFRHFNEIVMNAMRSLGVTGLRHAGTSDIAIGDKKIAGSALYRNKNTVFYHVILNLAEDPSAIERVLTMPPRMPDYRQGRSHSEFVTSLEEAGWTIDPEHLTATIESEWEHSQISPHIERLMPTSTPIATSVTLF